MLKKYIKSIDFDRFLIGIHILFIISPIIIFFWGWTRWYIALICSAALIYMGIQIYKNIEINYEYSIKKNTGFWIVSLIIIGLWALFSGIGGFSYQTNDFAGRNSIFRDLCTYGWPIYYDLSLEPDFVKSVLPQGGTATFVYYFAWWLPIACISKITGCTESVLNIFLVIWAILCLFLIYYCLIQYLKKFSYWILATFVLFSGLDAIMFIMRYMKIPSGHLEFYCDYFQYSANTTQLYWVFNQSIPVWMIVSTFLLLKNSNCTCGLSSLAFAYSPFATIGMIPVAVASVFNKGKRKTECLKNALTFENIAVPIIMLIIFGSFYMQNTNSLGDSGLIFQIHPEFRTFTIYIIFIFIEFVIYFIALGNLAKKYRFYWITFFELLVIPFFKAGAYNDFCMRTSIPALFLLMTLVLQVYLESPQKLRTQAIQTLLIIGFITSLTEITRNVSNTLNMSEEEYINESIYSLGNMKTENKDQILLHINQYMPTDFEDSFFYKYIAEQ